MKPPISFILSSRLSRFSKIVRGHGERAKLMKRIMLSTGVIKKTVYQNGRSTIKAVNGNMKKAKTLIKTMVR
jgi:hypothetical protein